MRISKLFLSSAFVGVAILGANTAYGQCSGGNCPVSGPYDQTPSYPRYQDNRYVQGNQNPNWQGNQSVYWRNDNGWRDGNSLSYGNQMNALENNEYPNMYGNADAPAKEHFSSPSSNFAQGNFNTINSSTSINDPALNNRFSPSSGNNKNAFATSRESTPAANNTYAASTPNSDTIDQHAYFQHQNGQGYFYQDLSQGNKDADTKGDSDTLVKHKITDALKSNYLRKNYNDLTISISNGNVTITGRVDTDEDRADAESRVKGIQGVKGVNNQIQVSPSSTSNSDNTSDRYDGSYHISNEDLQKQVDSTIKNNYVKKNYESVSTTVFNGIVTLKGTVETDRDRQEIKERVLKIKGVRNIQDDLKVSSSASQTSLRNSKKLNNSR